MTPLGRDLPEVYPDKSRKMLYFTIIFAMLLIPFIMLYEDIFRKHGSEIVVAFQTSKQSFHMHNTVGRIMYTMDIGDVTKHWVTKGLSTLSFGNLNFYSSEEKRIELSDAARMSVNRNNIYQEVLGFGGAFTESAAINFFKLPSDTRENIISLYFKPLRESHDLLVNTDSKSPIDESIPKSSKNLKSTTTSSSSRSGTWLEKELNSFSSFWPKSFTRGKQDVNEESGLTMGRIHINSCDFSLDPYNFDNVTNDYDLNFFDHDVTHDTLQIIPFIDEAMSASSHTIKLVASPWSPPSWMKAADSLNKSSMLGSALPNGLRDDPKVKLAWARYISYFVSAYARKGVPIWGVTPQNEPEFPAPWEACSYTAQYEADFIGNYLGPIIKNDHPDIKLLAFDHNKDHLKRWTEVMFSGSSSAKNFIDGMAFHCK